MLLISWKLIQAKIILPMTVTACCSWIFFHVLLPDDNVAAIAAVLVSQSGQKETVMFGHKSPENFICKASWCKLICSTLVKGTKS